MLNEYLTLHKSKFYQVSQDKCPFSMLKPFSKTGSFMGHHLERVSYMS